MAAVALLAVAVILCSCRSKHRNEIPRSGPAVVSYEIFDEKNLRAIDTKGRLLPADIEEIVLHRQTLEPDTPDDGRMLGSPLSLAYTVEFVVAKDGVKPSDLVILYFDMNFVLLEELLDDERCRRLSEWLEGVVSSEKEGSVETGAGKSD